jgi:hypothetical protein
MKYFAARRFRNASITIAALVVLWLWVRADQRALQPTAFSTGYLLFGAIGFLALYNLRKKLPFLPLGSSAAWLQWHLYVGMGTIGIFALHVGPNWPHGALNVALAVLYLLTVGSGFVGLYLSRTIPAQLTRVGQEVVFERIPALRHRVRQQASELALQAVAASGATTLADFYTTRLYDYFEQSRGWSYDLRPTTARRRALMREMHDIRRYLSDQEQSFCERLFALVRKKDDLDYHESRQRILKLWLFVHIGLTCALVLFASLHGLLAIAFAGGGA